MKSFTLLREPLRLIDNLTGHLVAEPWQVDTERDVSEPDRFGKRHVGGLRQSVTTPEYGTIPAVVEVQLCR